MQDQASPEGVAPPKPPLDLGPGQIPHPLRPDEPTTFDDLLAEYTALKAEDHDLKDRRGEIKPDLDRMQRVLIDGWIERKWTKGPTIAGAGTPYLFRQGWAKVKGTGPVDPATGKPQVTEADKERARKALRRAGLGDQLTETWNAQTLSATYREWEREGADPPPELDDVFVFEKVPEIRVRRS